MPAVVTDQLAERFRLEDLNVFKPDEINRFGLAGAGVSKPSAHKALVKRLGWDLLYRIQPELYDQLIHGESLHPAALAYLPNRIGQAIEVGAGTGRLTVELAPRCRSLLAIEPARPMAERLVQRLRALDLNHTTVRRGFFDSLPAGSDCADLVIAYSAFGTDPAHGGPDGLREMNRVLAPGGALVLVTSVDRSWLAGHGFEVWELPAGPDVGFSSLDEALELAAVFYPEAYAEIARRRLPTVPRALLHPAGQCLAVRTKR